MLFVKIALTLGYISESTRGAKKIVLIMIQNSYGYNYLYRNQEGICDGVD